MDVFDFFHPRRPRTPTSKSTSEPLATILRSSILRPPALPPSHTKHGLATPPAIKKHSTGIRQEISLSKSKSHECELSGASREEMLMGEVGAMTSTTGTNERVDSSGYSSASEAPSATRKRLHSSKPEAGEVAHSPIASPLSPPVPPSDRLKVENSCHALTSRNNNLLFSIFYSIPMFYFQPHHHHRQIPPMMLKILTRMLRYRGLRTLRVRPTHLLSIDQWHT